MILAAKDKRLGEGGLQTKGIYKKFYPDKPLVSIVTVVYNGEEFIDEAITSVINQDYDNIEYILIDGGSKDNTVDIIKKYEDQIDYWISEPDKGQSDAFIKAFKICRGEWLTWLNGDDLLLPGAISKLIHAAQRYPFVECFTGNVIWTTADNKIVQCRKGEAWNNLLPKLGLLNVYGPTTFFKRSLYERVEGINKDLHYKMDTDLWWQFYRAGAKFKRLKKYTWTLRLHENAKMSGHNFENSIQSDLSHPSWEIKRKEKEYFERKYNIESRSFALILGKIILIFNRFFSWQYLKSLFHSKRYIGMELKIFYLEVIMCSNK